MTKLMYTQNKSTLLKLKQPIYGPRCYHNTMCGLNASTENGTAASNYQLNKPGTWNSTYPHPSNRVLATFNEDHLFRLVKEKQLLISKLGSIKKTYNTCKNSSNDSCFIEITRKDFNEVFFAVESKLQRIENGNIHSNYVQMFAETKARDPDKYFNGFYDWYFTGGSMDFINFGGEEFLAHSEGNELQNLRISTLYSDSSIKTLDAFNKRLSPMFDGKTIYEITSTLIKPYLTVRQKHALSVMDLSSRNLILGKISSDIPLVTSSMELSTEKLILVDAKQHLSMYDLSDLKTPYIEGTIFNHEMRIDNWSVVRFVDQNLFLCANRQKMCVFDVRQPIFKKPSIVYDLPDSHGSCGYITCLEPSKTSHNTFIATTHNLLALDMRCCKVNYMPMLRWIHQLKTTPIMLDIVSKDSDGELIAVAGLQSGDIRICDTTISDDITISSHLPYKPKSIYDSYKLARSFAKCLNPQSLVSQQVRLSNSGIKFKQINFNANKYLMLTKNSCGDIFTQEIFRKGNDDFAEFKVANEIEAWDKALIAEKGKESTFQSSDITNFESMATFLRSNMLKRRTEISNEPVNAKTPEWKRSIQELSSFKDILVESILEEWDITPDVQITDLASNSINTMDEWLESAVNTTAINAASVLMNQVDVERNVAREESRTETIRRSTRKRNSKVAGF